MTMNEYKCRKSIVNSRIGKPEISCRSSFARESRGNLKKFHGKLINLGIRTPGNEPEAGLIGNGSRNSVFDWDDLSKTK